MMGASVSRRNRCRCKPSPVGCAKQQGRYVLQTSEAQSRLGSDAPALSCVIPCYENLHLFSRCLASVLTQQDIDLEVIVSDDSRSAAIADYVASLQSSFPKLHYFPGPRSGNPVDNWNRGLDQAKGRYCVVVHHDEFFLNARVLARSVSELEGKGLGVAIGRAVVIGPSRHGLTPTALLSRLPWWTLLIVNWIGPTGCVVFERSDALRFDPGLVRAVDVEFYVRLFSTLRGVYRFDEATVGSVLHGEQITAKIDSHRLHVEEVVAVSQDPALGLAPGQRRMLRGLIRAAGFLKGVR